MILLILFCFFTGSAVINIVCKKIELSKFLILSIPVGIVIHTFIFLLLSFVDVYYNKYLFIIFSLISIISFLKKRIQIQNDLKEIPIYYILFLIYILYRLLLMATTGFFEFYNYDEFTAYQTGSTITYLSHRFVEIYQTYAPINYFVGVMSLEFVGLSVTASRIFSVIFFCLTSLFIWKALRENKVSTHISALLAMSFLLASSEMLQMAKGFYTNIFFMTYFTIGIYGLIHYYFVQKDKGIPYLYFIVTIGAFLTRRETMYFILCILFFLSIIALVKKMIHKKQFIFMNLPILFPLLWKVMEQKYAFTFGLSISGNSESFFTRFKVENLKQFLESVYTQTIKPDYYFFNTIVFALFFLTMIVILYQFVSKKRRTDITVFAGVIVLIEWIYIGIILATEVILFNMNEYLQAASFSRYIVPVLEINFILIGCLLFQNIDQLEKSKPKETAKIKNPKVLLIIPAYNEEKSILKTVTTIESYNKENDKKYDYIVINDGSKDKTEMILNQHCINHIELIQNLGIGGAVQTGYKYAYRKGYDIAVQFDGDGQHDINYVKHLIKPIIEGKSAFVIGSRFKEKNKNTFQSSFLRRIGIRCISIAMKAVTNEVIYDTTSGFRAANKEVIQEFEREYPVEYPEPISTVSLLKKGYLVSEVQVNMKEREEGESSIKTWKDAYYMINVFLSIIVVGMRGKK